MSEKSSGKQPSNGILGVPIVHGLPAGMWCCYKYIHLRQTYSDRKSHEECAKKYNTLLRPLAPEKE